MTTRYVAQLFEAVGTDAIVTLDVHNPAAFENAFRCRTGPDGGAAVRRLSPSGSRTETLCVVSPDTGGVKRAELFRETLEAARGRPVGKGFADKHRSAGVVSGDLFVGEVAGATALVIDDLISTGATLVRAARAARQAGARRVIALVTHGLFMAGAADGDRRSGHRSDWSSPIRVPPFRRRRGRRARQDRDAAGGAAAGRDHSPTACRAPSPICSSSEHALQPPASRAARSR